MCMFCVGVPTAVTLGMAAVARQRTTETVAAARGETPPKPRLPAGPLTALVVVLLAIGSALFHLKYPA